MLILLTEYFDIRIQICINIIKFLTDSNKNRNYPIKAQKYFAD